MTEWKPVEGFEGKYEVSDAGELRSLDREDTIGRKIKGRAIKPCVAGAGYLNYMGFNIHRKVAAAFLGSAAGRTVNHINGNKQDNRVENLEYLTHSENTLHALGNKLLGRDNKGKFASV